MRLLLKFRVIVVLAVVGLVASASAQTAPDRAAPVLEAAPVPDPAPATRSDLDAPTAEPTPAPAVKSVDVPDPVEEPATDSSEQVAPQFVELRVHVITSSNIYDDLEFDIFSVSTREVVGRAQGANEAVGEPVAAFELEPGIYKIIKAGESFDTNVDFATVVLEADTDFLIVVDADTGTFRGSGVVTDELPDGLKIGGVRIALNVGGSLWLNQKTNTVGGTNGVSSLVGLFGNFGMVFDDGPHFLTVDAKLQLNLQDAPTSGVVATTDYLEANALYAFNINNPYVGPYARAGFKTRVFPGYLYLREEEGGTGQVVIDRLDGSTDTHTFGSEAHADDLRLEVAQPFAPFILQEEIGANLKAVDLDLKLLQMSVATRVGWGFRQGITNGLLVVDGSESGTPVRLHEVDDYFTTGPLVGANASLTFARWLFGQANFGVLAPVQDTDRAGTGFARRLLLDASGTAGLKFPALTSFLHASFDYTFRLQRDGYLTSATMFDQIVMVRVSLQLF